jgi:hypothetical protein
MKKLFGLWQLEEAQNFHAPVQDSTSFNRSVDSYTKKYVILK